PGRFRRRSHGRRRGKTTAATVRHDAGNVATESAIWKPALQTGTRFFRLFISHTHAYRRDVGLLASALSAHGVAAFVAHDAIQPTKQWLDVIVQALKECEALAAWLTSDFH